jgi:nucleoside-diphosphate-sugar epimerase
MFNRKILITGACSFISSHLAEHFIDVLLEQYFGKFKINYIKSISELKEGIVFTPCLPSAATYF